MSSNTARSALLTLFLLKYNETWLMHRGSFASLFACIFGKGCDHCQMLRCLTDALKEKLSCLACQKWSLRLRGIGSECVRKYLACSRHNSTCSKRHITIAETHVRTATRLLQHNNATYTIHDRSLLLFFFLQSAMRVQMKPCA